MKVQGQRWEFQIGNTRVVVENAWNWVGYSQERVRVNGEILYERTGWFYFVINSTIVAEFDVLDVDHAVAVGLQSNGGDYNIWCRIITEDTVYKPDDWSEATWDTQTYLWPPDPNPFEM
ncbi:MAG: hypothetical protein AAGF20_03525 [Pseudomonadota bacterium]